ncbi:MAG: hypothetical protein N2314_08865 [Brevinematales bacterium]|nr:hypothetical protein [Brevinematales bacterium]
MKKIWKGWLLLVLVGCGSQRDQTEVFFLNRLVVLDEALSQMLDREFLPIAVLRYRWLGVSRAIVYGMDEKEKRGWWLWERGRKRFIPLEDEVQGFDVSGQKVLVIGSTWEEGFFLRIGKIEGKNFVPEVTCRFPLIPENSLGVEDGFYLAGRDEKGVHTVFFVSFAGGLDKRLALTNAHATLRFGRLAGRPMVYTSYEKGRGESLFAFLDAKPLEWRTLTHEGTVVQKAVFLGEVMGVPVKQGENITWRVFDREMKPIGSGPEWKGVVFEELAERRGEKKGIFLCFLPSELRSILVVFHWDGVQWSWKTFSP